MNILRNHRDYERKITAFLSIKAQKKAISVETALYFDVSQKVLYSFGPATFALCRAKLLSALAYSLGPAATRALPASLPSYFLKFLMKRAARSLAFSSHSLRF